MLWLIIGLIVGAGAFWLVTLTRARKINVAWYEWALAVIAAASALLAIQNFEASFAELEPRAAWALLAMFGVPALLVAGATWLLIKRHNRATSAPSKS